MPDTHTSLPEKESFLPEHGTVYLVATPIGNLRDIALRALDVLRGVDLIACEDTRHSARLLQKFGIETPRVSLHAHNEAARTAELVTKLHDGLRLALISDAGSPLISDPGLRLVHRCRVEGIPVSPIPGPSAPIAALLGSGFPADQFRFLGFLPVKKGKRREVLASAIAASETTVCFESPHRIDGTLEILAELDPVRRVCIARELTKTFETFHRGTAIELANEFSNKTAKGEITLLIAGNDQPKFLQIEHFQ